VKAGQLVVYYSVQDIQEDLDDELPSSGIYLKDKRGFTVVIPCNDG
jgi:hypothetical protein